MIKRKEKKKTIAVNGNFNLEIKHFVQEQKKKKKQQQQQKNKIYEK